MAADSDQRQRAQARVAATLDLDVLAMQLELLAVECKSCSWYDVDAIRRLIRAMSGPVLPVRNGPITAALVLMLLRQLASWRGHAAAARPH